MRSVLLLFTFICLIQDEVYAQKMKNELGITASPYLGIGVAYRFGKEEIYWRITSMLLRKNDTFMNSVPTYRIGGSFLAGVEGRVPLSSLFTAKLGVDIGFTYLNHKLQNPNQTDKILYTIVAPQINLVFGINLTLKNKWVIGLELLPYIRYDNITKINGSNLGILVNSLTSLNYGANGNSIQLLVSYRF